MLPKNKYYITNRGTDENGAIKEMLEGPFKTFELPRLLLISFI